MIFQSISPGASARPIKRRLYATTLYDAGTDLDSLRRLMRHESVNTTLRCYITADPRRMAAAEDAVVDDLFGDPSMFS